MDTPTSDDSETSFGNSSVSTRIRWCGACGKLCNQPISDLIADYFCSERCEKLMNVPFPPAPRKAVFRGNRSPAFKREFQTRLGFMNAWAEAKHPLSIYTMDLFPWKDMIDHEQVSPWPNPWACHKQALRSAYNMAHHDECGGLYRQARLSLLWAIVRVFLMWDITQLGIMRSKVVGICLDQMKEAYLEGEEVITIPDQLFESDVMQVAWYWPKAIEAAIHATSDSPNPPCEDVGIFEFDRSHWDIAVEVIREVGGSVWED